jgi:hypothetical protein
VLLTIYLHAHASAHTPASTTHTPATAAAHASTATAAHTSAATAAHTSAATTAAHAEVVGYISLLGRRIFAEFICGDGIAYFTGNAGYYLDPCCGEDLVCIRAAVAGNDGLDALLDDCLGRRYTSPAGSRNAGIIHGLKLSRFRINDDELLAPPEARVDNGIQGGTGGRNGYLHISSL